MRSREHSFTFAGIRVGLFWLILLLGKDGLAADPGAPYLHDLAPSDQKAGSVLVYNLYTSDVTSPAVHNTRIAITNTSVLIPVAVHLFFVDGVSRSIADFVVCLTPNQTISYETSELDPSTEGYILAVAVDLNGLPIVHNFLIGDMFVKYGSGHQAGLSAMGVAARAMPAMSSLSVAVDLAFDDLQYERLPAVLVIDNIPSRVNNNDTMMVINRLGGDMALGASELGPVFGLLYNDVENSHSYTLSSPRTQLRYQMTNLMPRTTPRFTTVIPDGRSGWSKFYAVPTAAITGVMLTYHPGSLGAPNAFTGGHNLHHLTRTSTTISIPVYPISCFSR
jgi:hypothetical protein